jgi:predicted DNA-binding protein
VLETDVPTEKPRFSISLSPEFVERLETYCERHSETKSKVLEELADIIIGMPEQKLHALERWADEEFRTVPDQVRQLLHRKISEREQ